jgi:uncharacterized protein (PEP-CTERM system associated)
MTRRKWLCVCSCVGLTIAIEGYHAKAQSQGIGLTPPESGSLPTSSVPSAGSPLTSPEPPTDSTPPVTSAPVPPTTPPNPQGTAPGQNGTAPTPPVLAPPTLFPGGLGLGLGAAPAFVPGAAPAPLLAPPPAAGLAPLAPGAAPIQAGDVRAPPLLVNSSVALFQGFNDNPEATPNTLADIYTHLQSGLNVSVDSVRFQGQLSSNLDLVKFARATDQDSLNSSLLGFGLATVVPDHFVVDVRASNTQVSRLGGVAFENPTLIPPSQATQAFTFALTPILRQSFGDLFDADLRYSFGATSFTNGNAFGLFGNPTTQPSAVPLTTLSSTTQSDATFSLATGSRFSLFSSKLTVEDTIINSSSVAQSTQFQAVDLVQYKLNPYFSILGSFGYEDFSFPQQPAASTQGLVYSLGGQYVSGDGTYITLTDGRQSGSHGLNGSARYQVTAATGIYASLQKNLTTAQQQLLSNLTNSTLSANGTLVNQTTLLPIALINPALSFVANNVVQNEQFQIGADTALDRNSFSLTAFLDHVTAVGPAQAGLSATAALLSGNDVTRGINFSWSRSLTPDLTSTTAVGYSSDVAAHAKTLTFDFSLSYTISPSLLWSFRYDLLDQRTNIIGASFERNLVEIGLRKTF